MSTVPEATRRLPLALETPSLVRALAMEHQGQLIHAYNWWSDAALQRLYQVLDEEQVSARLKAVRVRFELEKA